ncbi:imidazole glycerol phosphate synthase subunit HisH [Synechococcus sp. HK01-R]|uniref:imidazole glycerol phosphate synthase subunit HisH n=1 Tax=Synechococcus sp. HK01-R TaxID=2751171 RepID=UPI001627EDB0|nr:imidazole glycerol phosphate synthase subunit HisH [Synechococcus sp. HK01-R]QNG27764.1 imidazole glycerol phosphate synthase subunit HisH [Synechococcus sp. HK01-R]
MIKIVNFPFCNISSVLRCLDNLGVDFSVLNNSSEINSDDIVVLPGVGTFQEGMNFLRQNGYVPALTNHALSEGRIIGICLGMQLLLSRSEESPCVSGLSLIPGACSQLPACNDFLVPHIGWNSISHNPLCTDSFAFLGSESSSLYSSKDFYFVHSYVACAENQSSEMFYFDHPRGRMVAALCNSNTVGFQFHPEKSGPAGYELLLRFLR